MFNFYKNDEWKECFNMSGSSCNNLESGIKKVKDIFDMGLKIPPYQRPYSWTDEQVTALIDDIIEAWKNNKKVYLVGNIIFHKEDRKYNIVDGQQRLITFALMFHILDKLLNKNRDIEFLNQNISILSIKRLKQNYNIIKQRFENIKRSNYLDDFKGYLQKQIIITYLSTENQDEAFLLFDSQNTRGKSLLRKDLLKVHHIRHMQEEIKQEIAPSLVVFVKKWEKNEKIEQESFGEDNDFLEFMFDQILGITRKAVRRDIKANDMQKVDVYKEFKSHGVSNKLNNYNQPQLFESYSYDLDKEMVQYSPKFLDFNAPYMLKGFESLPFEVTQSIAGGSSFFLFTQKYVYLLQKLRQNEIFTMIDTVSGAGNAYLRKVYRSALFYFYDKFEDELFEKFGLYLFLLLAYYRANSGSIYDKGVVKFQWDGEKRFDIYQEILLSYSPEHIIQSIKTYILSHCQDFKETDKAKWFKKEFKGTIKDFWDSSKKFQSKRDEIFLELWGEEK